MTIEVIDKSQIARSFGKAAVSYDSVAHFQRWTADKLLTKVGDVTVQRLLDLGCGTGYSSDHLCARFDTCNYFGLDLSKDMLTYASSKHGKDSRYWIAGDAENLPLSSDSLDLVFSSLAIQWCSDLPKMFSEVCRVLRPGGVFAFSTLADGSLKELADAWKAADDRQHVNNFEPTEDVRSSLNGISFEIECFEQEEVVLKYDSVRELTRELKLLGAHNMTADRPTRLTGKAALREFVAAYEKMRVPEGYLPATYQVLWGVLVKT
jgi:malonyl-CoA O-methyltransferase